MPSEDSSRPLRIRQFRRLTEMERFCTRGGARAVDDYDGQPKKEILEMKIKSILMFAILTISLSA